MDHLKDILSIYKTMMKLWLTLSKLSEWCLLFAVGVRANCCCCCSWCLSYSSYCCCCCCCWKLYSSENCDKHQNVCLINESALCCFLCCIWWNYFSTFVFNINQLWCRTHLFLLKELGQWLGIEIKTVANYNYLSQSVHWKACNQ